MGFTVAASIYRRGTCEENVRAHTCAHCTIQERGTHHTPCCEICARPGFWSSSNLHLIRSARPLNGSGEFHSEEGGGREKGLVFRLRSRCRTLRRTVANLRSKFLFYLFFFCQFRELRSSREKSERTAICRSSFNFKWTLTEF